MAEVMILIKHKPNAWKKRVSRAFIIGIPAFIFSLVAVYGAGGEIVFYGFIILMLGTPVYSLSKIKQAQQKD